MVVKVGIRGRLKLQTWRDGQLTGEQVAENIVCLNGLSDLAAAVAWAAAQDQGAQIGAVSNFLTPVYGAVGNGTSPPYAITGSVAAGSSIIQPYSPPPVTATGTLTSGSPTITATSNTGVYTGMVLTDLAGLIPSGTTVLSSTSTTITMSNNATGTLTESFTVGYSFLEGMVIQDSSGLVPPYTVVVSSAGNAITMSGPSSGSSLSVPVPLDTIVTGTSTATTHTVDVTAGALIVVVVGAYNGGSPAFGISDTLGGLSLTLVDVDNPTSFATPAIYYAVASTTTDGTITVTNTSGTALTIQPWQITGQNAAPVTQSLVVSASNNGQFTNAPAANSMVFSVACDATTGTAPTWTTPNGSTSIMATQVSGRAYTAAAYQLGSAYQMVAWGETNPANPAIVAIEIAPTLGESIVVGTDNSDTTLYSEFQRVQVSAVAASPATGAGSTTLMQFQFAANTATESVTEAAVFVLADSGTNDGDMLDHCIFSPAFSWTAGDSMTLSAEFIWNFP